MDTRKPDSLTGIDLISAILQNIHESLKWLFQLVMALAMVNAIRVYGDSLDTLIIHNPYDFIIIFFNINTIVFISFIIVFVRFYFGDARYLDLSYLETQYFYGLRDEIARFSGWKRFADIVLLLSHGICFFLMSSYMQSPRNYLYFFVLLLIVNITWLVLQLIFKFGDLFTELIGLKVEKSTSYRKIRKEVLMGYMENYKPLLIWVTNNAAFVIFLLLLFLISNQNYALYIALGLTFANSLVDLFSAWKYYFPNLENIYYDSLKIILKNNEIGRLVLTKERLLNKNLLNRLFPEYIIEQKDLDGITYYSFLDREDELFYVKTIQDDSTRIDKLYVTSAKIVDEYGLKIGSTFQDIIRVRPDITYKIDYELKIASAWSSGKNINYELKGNYENDGKTILTKEQIKDWKIKYLIWSE